MNHDSPRPTCEKYDPELWFPEVSINQTQYTQKGKKIIEKAVQALKVCQHCPLMANGECLEYTFQSLDSIRYGISAGLLPTEKRKMIGYSMADVSEPFFGAIRRQAIAEGIPTPDQPKREKPKPLYSLHEWDILKERFAE
jgi:hypothetical protein